ncbi:transmembrane protein dusky [Tachypleus tridentatus]|uniref:transmembrane protein dusky n=1 Tax=Tachypleus tridentatus TaxID=6853 RepID=UPI003FD3FB8E
MMLWSKTLLILAISLKVTTIAEEAEEKIEKGNPDQILEKMSSEIDTVENQEEKAYPSRKQYQTPPRPPPHSGFGPLLTHHESPSIPVPLPLPSLQGSLIFPALPQKVQKGRPGGYAVDHLSPKDQLGGYGSPQPIYTSRLGSKNNNFPGFPNLPGSDTWPLPQPEMPVIIHLDVKCEKNLMKVAVEFDKAFHGIIFSKGHYNYGNCVHLPAGSGRKSVYFDISINSCGTTGNTENGLYGYGGNSGSGTFFENTIIVQYDPQVQEVWDQARKLRCTWHDQYEKAVTFRPFPVDMLDVVRADFAGDNVGCWMQIQVGKGPWASEAAGIVKIGQTMTMVLAIKDDENRFDMLVRNCIAHDGKRAPIELVDGRGCIVRSKLMSRFTKIKNFGSSASVLSYAHFQAFKFPDSMEVHFQCTIQICRYQCPEQCVYPVDHTAAAREGIQGPHPGYVPAGRPREERDVSFSDNSKGTPSSSLEEMTEIGLNRVIRVVSVGDLAFSLKTNDSTPVRDTYDIEDSGVICMSTPGFVASLVVLLAILVVSSLFSAFLCLKQRSPDGAASTLSYDLPVLKKNKY